MVFPFWTKYFSMAFKFWVTKDHCEALSSVHFVGWSTTVKIRVPHGVRIGKTADSLAVITIGVARVNGSHGARQTVGFDHVEFVACWAIRLSGLTVTVARPVGGARETIFLLTIPSSGAATKKRAALRPHIWNSTHVRLEADFSAQHLKHSIPIL